MKEERNIVHTIKRLTGLVTSCVGNVFENKLLKGRETRREGDEEDISSY